MATNRSASNSDFVVPIWINGVAVEAPKIHTFPVTSSITNEVVHHAQSVDIATAQAACDAATNAFKSWKRTSISTRRDMLLRVADIFSQRASDFIKIQMEETSCDEPWAQNNITTTVNYLREIASCISTSIQGTIPSLEKPNTMGFIFKEPVGSILVIPPWNAAMILCCRALTSAVGAGCTVVLKASELCPKTHYMMVQVFEEAGLPKGVINQVQARREDAAQVTEALIAHPAIRKVDFIGSAAVGKIIAATAAKYLKPVLMELGSKTPAIVLDDADLQKAAFLCAKGATMHHGQICFSTERVIVHQKVAEEFQNFLVQAFANLPPGNPAVNEAGAKHAEDVLRDAQDKGAKLLVGGIDYSKPATLKPTIVLEPRASRIVDEETFGPSASLYAVESDEEAIALANKTVYGLNATIHTRDLARGINIARELEYGQVHINSMTVFTASTGSQGGVKGSGWGRMNAGWGLSEFLVEKFVSYHTD
ncbi:MAG: hypothetical protein M1820_003373 [Bogoriella megaspora]|nr:MAG: hypothetical protein M1820_003373 [Bogoriella megaspora]